MLLTKLLSGTPEPKIDPDTTPRSDYAPSWGYRTDSGQRVSVEGSQAIATTYRAKNIISDDVGRLPLQIMRRNGRSIEQVQPDPVTRNMAYLMQISPNLWGWTPFLLKKRSIEWLLFYGNNYLWSPIVGPRQIMILAASRTAPVFDVDGNLWYAHTFINGKSVYIPAVEILHLMINPDDTGFMGRGVITFARETFGRRLAANKAQAKFYAQGFMPAAYVQMEGELSREARRKLKAEYSEALSGSENAYSLAVFDQKIAKFEPINIQLKDAQFLESIDATDQDICNFFGIPEYKLNRGKQAYNSNEQQNIDYLGTTLDPILVPWEEAARIRWLSQGEQSSGFYFKFIREALLRMDAKTRGEVLTQRIQNGMITPNEALEKEDMSGYEGGDQHFIQNIMVPIDQAGAQGPVVLGSDLRR